MHITISKSLTAAAAQASPRVLETAAMFGLGVDADRCINVVPRCDIALPAGGIVFITGPSGSGKSTILRLIEDACMDAGTNVISLDRLPPLPAGRAVIDGLGATLEQAMSLLSLAGLGDAFVMLRRPCELSDGQRSRLRLAQALELARAHWPREQRTIVLADEFAATLDRITAKTIARNLRRWISRTPLTFIAATTHDDLLESLEPEVLVFKGPGDELEVVQR